MNPANIFISKSGSNSESISSLLEIFFYSIFGKEIKVFTSESMPTGTLWFDKLRHKASRCDIFIALVDSNFHKSPWCNLELGCFIKDRENEEFEGALYPIKTGNCDDKVFSITQIRRFEDEKIDVLKEITDKIKDILPAVEVDYDLFSTESESFREKIKLIQLAESSQKKTIDTFHKYIQTSIETYLMDSLTLKKKAAKYKEYWSYALDQTIVEKLNDIGNAIIQSKRISEEDEPDDKKIDGTSDDKNSWGKIWHEMTMYQINHTVINLSNVTARKISLVDTQAIANFWVKTIIPKARETIWTTNLPGTNGRKTGPARLDPQEKAIQRGVKITRVFVYSADDIIDRENLTIVIEKQLKIGIKIFVIKKEQFEEAIAAAVQSTENLDFMIIDNRFTYKTIIDSDQIHTKQLLFEDSGRELEILEGVKAEIEKIYVPITSVDEFDNILSNIM